jgi:hypothetical protein
MDRKRRRKQKSRSIVLDDYFAAGPFEFARFGRLVVSRSRGSAANWQAANTKLAASLSTITVEIDERIGQIAEQVAKLPGERLLHRAWWDFAMINIMRDGSQQAACEWAMEWIVCLG